eukprot:360426-Chlamydomonas_euryale.AAC.8
MHGCNSEGPAAAMHGSSKEGQTADMHGSSRDGPGADMNGSSREDLAMQGSTGKDEPQLCMATARKGQLLSYLAALGASSC